MWGNSSFAGFVTKQAPSQGSLRRGRQRARRYCTSARREPRFLAFFDESETDLVARYPNSSIVIMRTTFAFTSNCGYPCPSAVLQSHQPRPPTCQAAVPDQNLESQKRETENACVRRDCRARRREYGCGPTTAERTGRDKDSPWVFLHTLTPIIAPSKRQHLARLSLLSAPKSISVVETAQRTD
ncbi:hypothetical protein L209DRAFT_30415 [Thermothelomyces heterothallicus CBS 203.75]